MTRNEGELPSVFAGGAAPAASGVAAAGSGGRDYLPSVNDGDDDEGAASAEADPPKRRVVASERGTGEGSGRGSASGGGAGRRDWPKSRLSVTEFRSLDRGRVASTRAAQR